MAGFGCFWWELKTKSKKIRKNLDFLSSVPKDTDVLEVWNARITVATDRGIYSST